MTIGTPNMNKLATNSSIKYLMSLIVVLTNWTYFAVPSNNLIQSKVFRINEKLVIADIIDRSSDDIHELFGKLVTTIIGVNINKMISLMFQIELKCSKTVPDVLN